MTTENTPEPTIDHTESFDILEEELNKERSGFDLFARLTERPKRKPAVITLYMDESVGAELGYANDMLNEFGTPVGRDRAGVVGDLDKVREDWANAEKADDPDPKVVEGYKAMAEELSKQAQELIERAKKNSLTVTMQWVPPIVAKSVELRAMRSIGVKQAPIPKSKVEAFADAYIVRLLEATVTSIVDNSNGTTKDGITIHEAVTLKRYLPKEQFDRLDIALNKLINRKAIADEVLDNADF